MQKGLKLFTVSWEQIKRRQKSFWWWYIPTPENSNEYCLKYEMCVLFQAKGLTNRRANPGIIYPYGSVAFTFEFIGYNSFFILTFLWLNIQTNYKAYKCTYHIYVVSLSMPKRK